MAKNTFLIDIDLNNNQLLNASLQNLATPPSVVGKTPGWVYWNTTTKTAYAYTGNVAPNEWIDLGWIAPIVSSSAGNNNSLVVIESITLDVNGYITSFKTKDITTGVRSTIINDAATNLTQTWSSTFIQGKLDAITSAIAGGVINKGGYDAITNTPNLDVTPIAGIKNGWMYTVTAAATDNTTLFFTTPVAIGDVLIANQDNPTTLAHWTVVNKNIPDILPATETTSGTVEIATQAEVKAGAVSGGFAVSPLKLKTAMSGSSTPNGILPESSETLAGIVENATQAEVKAGALDSLYSVSPLKLKTAMSGSSTGNGILPESSQTLAGIARIATQVEATAGTDNTTIITPLTLKNVIAGSIVDATETVRGKVEIATQAEVDAGTLDAPYAVTPLKLATYVAAKLSATKYALDVPGNGVLTTFNFTHGLATLDVQVSLVEISTGETVFAQIRRTSTTVVNATFNIAPAASTYRIIIQK